MLSFEGEDCPGTYCELPLWNDLVQSVALFPANQDILDIEVTESTLPPPNGNAHAEQQMEQAPY